MQIGATITLSEDDRELCKDLARRRFNNNRRHKVANAKIGPQSNEFTDLEGIAGEFAFCRLAGFNPDKTVHSRSSKTDHGDVNGSGQEIDVKTTKYPRGKLLARITLRDKKDTLFVLMVGTFPRYKFAGCLQGSDWLDDTHIVDLGYGPTFSVGQSELRDLT